MMTSNDAGPESNRPTCSEVSAYLLSKCFFDYLQFSKSYSHHEANSASTRGILIIHDRSLESFIVLKYPAIAITIKAIYKSSF